VVVHGRGIVVLGKIRESLGGGLGFQWFGGLVQWMAGFSL